MNLNIEKGCGCALCDVDAKVVLDREGRYHEVYNTAFGCTILIECLRPSATILPFRKPKKEGEA